MQSNNQERHKKEAAACGAGHTPEGPTVDFSRETYKLRSITELIDTPEKALELRHDAFSGIRIVIEEVAAVLLNVEGAAEFIVNRSGYKLRTIAALLETPERASELGHDAWSGIRIILEETAEFLLNIETAKA